MTGAADLLYPLNIDRPLLYYCSRARWSTMPPKLRGVGRPAAPYERRPPGHYVARGPYPQNTSERRPHHVLPGPFRPDYRQPEFDTRDTAEQFEAAPSESADDFDDRVQSFWSSREALLSTLHTSGAYSDRPASSQARNKREVTQEPYDVDEHAEARAILSGIDNEEPEAPPGQSCVGIPSQLCAHLLHNNQCQHGASCAYSHNTSTGGKVAIAMLWRGVLRILHASLEYAIAADDAHAFVRLEGPDAADLHSVASGCHTGNLTVHGDLLRVPCSLLVHGTADTP